MIDWTCITWNNNRIENITIAKINEKNQCLKSENKEEITKKKQNPTKIAFAFCLICPFCISDLGFPEWMNDSAQVMDLKKIHKVKKKIRVS